MIQGAALLAGSALKAIASGLCERIGDPTKSSMKVSRHPGSRSTACDLVGPHALCRRRAGELAPGFACIVRSWAYHSQRRMAFCPSIV